MNKNIENWGNLWKQTLVQPCGKPCKVVPNLWQYSCHTTQLAHDWVQAQTKETQHIKDLLAFPGLSFPHLRDRESTTTSGRKGMDKKREQFYRKGYYFTVGQEEILLFVPWGWTLSRINQLQKGGIDVHTNLWKLPQAGTFPPFSGCFKVWLVVVTTVIIPSSRTLERSLLWVFCICFPAFLPSSSQGLSQPLGVCSIL